MARPRERTVVAKTKAFKLTHGENDSGIYIDPEKPDELCFVPSPDFPAALFVAFPAEEEALRAVLREFDPGKLPMKNISRTRRVRAYMGSASSLAVPNPYSGEMDAAGLHELGRHFNFSPAVTPYEWGTAYDDDPLVDYGAGENMLAMVAVTRKMLTQLEDAIPRFTRLGFYSGGQLGIEAHAAGHYYWQADYAPGVVSRATIAAFNELTKYRLPLDLPIDLAAAVHGFEFIDEANLLEMLETDSNTTALLFVLFGVVSTDLQKALALVRRYSALADLDIRGTVANACINFNWEFGLSDLGRNETNPELRESPKRARERAR